MFEPGVDAHVSKPPRIAGAGVGADAYAHLAKPFDLSSFETLDSPRTEVDTAALPLGALPLPLVDVVSGSGSNVRKSVTDPEEAIAGKRPRSLVVAA